MPQCELGVGAEESGAGGRWRRRRRRDELGWILLRQDRRPTSCPLFSPSLVFFPPSPICSACTHVPSFSLKCAVFTLSPSEHPSVPMQKYLPPAGCPGGSRRRHVRERFIVNEAFTVQLHHVTSLLFVLFFFFLKRLHKALEANHGHPKYKHDLLHYLMSLLRPRRSP